MSFRRFISFWIIVCFFLTTLGPLPKAHGSTALTTGADSVLGLPAPGTMVNLSPAYEPALIKGLTVHKDNPFLFDFIVDTGNSGIAGDELKTEGDRLVKYFFACLTIPEKDLWVNLSPYEKDRMVPQALGQTALGRDLLAQDYILKQLTASLIYPEKDLGRAFWDRVYAKARQMYGTTQIPVNTFNKVWIVADKATVYEHGQTVFVLDGHLKVMLEEDYLALQKHISKSTVILSEAKDLNKINSIRNSSATPQNDTHSVASQIVREIILPEIEKEVNTGKNFAALRQIYNSLILASWYKKNLKEALLNQVYANKSTVKGVNLADPSVKEQIYQQYLKAYKKGVFNYIKEDAQADGQIIPRKYFSGGFLVGEDFSPAVMTEKTPGSQAMISEAFKGTSIYSFSTTALPPGQFTRRGFLATAAGLSIKIASAQNRPSMSRKALLAQVKELHASFPNTENKINVVGPGRIRLSSQGNNGDFIELYYVIAIYDPNQGHSDAGENLIVTTLERRGGRNREITREFIYSTPLPGSLLTNNGLGVDLANNDRSNPIRSELETLGCLVPTNPHIPGKIPPRLYGNFRGFPGEFIDSYRPYTNSPEFVQFEEGLIAQAAKASFHEVVSKAVSQQGNRAMLTDKKERAIVRVIRKADLPMAKYFANRYWRDVAVRRIAQKRIRDLENDQAMGVEVEVRTIRTREMKREKVSWGKPWENSPDIEKLFIMPDEEGKAVVGISLKRKNVGGGWNNSLVKFDYNGDFKAIARIILQKFSKHQRIIRLYEGNFDLNSVAAYVADVLKNGEIEFEKTGKKVSPAENFNSLRRDLGRFPEGIVHVILNFLSKKPEDVSRIQLVMFNGAQRSLGLEQLDKGKGMYIYNSQKGIKIIFINNTWVRVAIVANRSALILEDSTEGQQISRGLLPKIMGKYGLKLQEHGENIKKVSAAMLVGKTTKLNFGDGVYTDPQEIEKIVDQERTPRQLELERMAAAVRKQGSSTSARERYEQAGSFTSLKKAREAADSAMRTKGGIDLNTSNGMQWKVSKDGTGVEMNIDPAMIERVRREGIDSLSPVIFRITPVTSIWPLVGLQAPVR